MSNNKYEQPERCLICNAIINDDGTVSECYGECGREIADKDKFEPLNFHDKSKTTKEVFSESTDDFSELYGEEDIDDYE